MTTATLTSKDLKTTKDMTPEQKAEIRARRKELRLKEKAEKLQSLVPFRSVAPAESLNAEGLLTSADVEAMGYDPEQHEPLSREDFASEDVWLVARARELRQKGQAMLDRADRMEREAVNIAQFGDPKKRAAVKRLQKVANSFAELSATLKAQGIDVDALLAGQIG